MYPRMYTTLFNAITRALEMLPKGDCTADARFVLEDAQREAEEIFMNWDWEKGDPEE